MKIRVRMFNSIYDFIDTCNTKFKLNHNLVLRDDPRSLQIGVFDQNTNEWLKIYIRDFKEIYKRNNLSKSEREFLASESGQKQLFHCN
mgnify:CR=1 FL=1